MCGLTVVHADKFNAYIGVEYTSSPWAGHKTRPTINVWTTTVSPCRQARTHKRNGVKHIITPGSHVARLVTCIGAKHLAITLGKDNNLNLVRNMACARRNNVATEKEKILSLEDNLQIPKTHAGVAQVGMQCRARTTVEAE